MKVQAQQLSAVMFYQLLLSREAKAMCTPSSSIESCFGVLLRVLWGCSDLSSQQAGSQKRRAQFASLVFPTGLVAKHTQDEMANFLVHGFPMAESFLSNLTVLTRSLAACSCSECGCLVAEGLRRSGLEVNLWLSTQMPKTGLRFRVRGWRIPPGPQPGSVPVGGNNNQHFELVAHFIFYLH